MKKEKQEDTGKDFVVRYNGFDIWTIDLREEGVIKILPSQEIELNPENKKHLHVILSVIKEYNKSSNEFSVVEKTKDGAKRVNYKKRFEIISQGMVPDELLKLEYGINQLYSPTNKELIKNLCSEYFEDKVKQ